MFSNDKFKNWAKKHVILVELDFPRRKELPERQKQQNEKLKQKFGVRGFPTVIFLDARGKELGRAVGYRPGTGPDKWIEQANQKLR